MGFFDGPSVPLYTSATTAPVRVVWDRVVIGTQVYLVPRLVQG
jgi:hypothetical protein